MSNKMDQSENGRFSPWHTENYEPRNTFIRPLLTDLYQMTMCYSYFVNKKHTDRCVFDLFFRKNPFGGEYTVFAGLEESLRFLNSFHFSEDEVEYVRSLLPSDANEDFFAYLKDMDCSEVKVYALKEGTLCFPREPLLRVEGPLGVVQLLETTLLNLVNYATLVCTQSARLRIACGKNKQLLEFGLRRAQGPDGAMSASRYSYMGGFDASSNMLAGKLFDIPVKGTHAHSFISTFADWSALCRQDIKAPDGKMIDFVSVVKEKREQLGFTDTNTGELTAFSAYAMAFPAGFLGLVDTYDTLASGVKNFLVVALALHSIGYKAVGIRLDSGDLAYLSTECRALFRRVAAELNIPYFANFTIVASNDLNEMTILSLNSQGHEIDVFGIGTHLVTCQAQPALGGVFKLVEIEGSPRIKLSQEIQKVTIPGKKNLYRIIGQSGAPLLDILSLEKEGELSAERVLCRHPFQESKRCYVVPTTVVPLLQLVWDGKFTSKFPTLAEIREYIQEQIFKLRSDHLRPINPTPYKLSVTDGLYDFMHSLWLSEAPITEFC
eukprot:GCRY01000781.1.p1 GENE.GCRY01000781.1~~GCRY01000781.1.p1  ORF type:complete len:550 (+),score=120.08 GCRY01000781.1:121-1770(+)